MFQCTSAPYYGELKNVSVAYTTIEELRDHFKMSVYEFTICFIL